MLETLRNLKQRMENRGFTVYLCEKAEDARIQALALIPPNASVGAGGSMTVAELGLLPELAAEGHQVWCHWINKDMDAQTVFDRARQADFYLSSSNAVTRDGEIVNIDGNANRVSAMIQGPKNVVLIISAQKVVDGGLNAAIGRIKQFACPANAKRLHLDTPCAKTGVCNEKNCGDACMCRVTTVINRPPHGRRVTVILVGETLGY